MKKPWAGLMFATSLAISSASAQDWPQWRGLNRDAQAASFHAPKTWPKELVQKWRVSVGEGVATPALVGDRLYVFSREDGNEVTRCLNAADGKEVWQAKYESLGASGPAQGFSGPRSSPAVAEGKIVTLGVRGRLSCLDAATGQRLWRKDEFHAYPQFHPSSSPMIVNGLAIAQLGGRDNGAVVAYDLATGNEKWKWTGPGPAYSSPALMNVGGTELIIANTESKLVGINAADGKLAWDSAPSAQAGGGGPGGMRGGGGRDYRVATPIVENDTLFIAGRGIRALRISKDGEQISGTELWNNSEKSVQFNTPVLKDGKLFGLTPNNELFCVNARDGKALWSSPLPGGPGAGGRASIDTSFSGALFGRPAQPPPPGNGGRRPGPGGPGGPPGGRRGGGMGGGGFGSVVNAGPVLFVLTPTAQLLVIQPSDKEFKVLASYKVAPSQTHAYPVVSGNRIFIKDKDAVTLWTVD